MFVSSSCRRIQPFEYQAPTPWPSAVGGGGRGLNIQGVVPTVGDLPTDARHGDVWLVQSNNHGHFWDGTAWQDIGPVFTGPAGPAGQAATIAIGTTTTGAPGSNAAVTNSGSSSAAVLNFTIPEGTAGQAGEGLTVGSATPPAAPDPGDLWTTVNGELFIWLGTSWRQV